MSLIYKNYIFYINYIFNRIKIMFYIIYIFNL
jgi:hypothetical protein